MGIARRILGKTGLEVSVLGFGGAPIGVLETEQKRVDHVLNLVLDEGVNLIDTAANYRGSEEAIGKAVGHRRDDYVLVSKCGRPLADPSGKAWSVRGITASIHQSLRRLGTDHLDVMLLHSCDLETLKRGEALGALVRARDAGRVRFVGYSGDNEAAAYAAELPEVAVIQTSVNVCDQANIDSVLPITERQNVGVMAKRPLANAAWKELSRQPGAYASYAKTYSERLAAMGITPAGLGFQGDASRLWPEIAMRFTLSQKGVHTAMIGTTDPEHAVANVRAAAQGPLPDEVNAQLRSAFQRAQSSAGELWRGDL